MDFHDLYNIIFKEEINEDYIIPQDQRILIFEDIDAMGEAVKCRDMKAAENTKKKEDEVIKVDAMNVLADLLNNKTSTTKKESLSCESLLYSPLLSSSSSSSNNNNLSYLLNMFDGINECSGRIIIMTSNKPEVLDKALIRPGRIDIKLNFQKCTRYDTMCLINLFWNTHFQEEQLLPDIDMKYTSADIYSIFRSTNDFEDISSLFIL
jgi:SpoVK/Ycf46/Vps4 family AAA+-type ATPase